MALTGSARARTAVVASAAVLAVVTATSMAGAHEGDDDVDSVHACVSNTGALRVPSPGQACRPNETPLHWKVDGGGSGSEDLDAFKTQLLAEDNVSDLVDWSNLANVPQWVLDGLPAWLQDGSVNFGDIAGLPAWLQDGSIGYAELSGSLPNDSVTGASVDDGTLTAADLAGDDVDGPVPGAVTSQKILDGTIEGRDISAGAVTPDKLSPTTVWSSDGLGTTTLTGGTLAPSMPASISTGAPSRTMVTGQVQLELQNTCVGCPAAVVSYQLLRNSLPVSPVYRVELSTTHVLDVATLSVLDTVPVGTSAYQIRLSSPVSFVASLGVLNVQVLGPA